MGVIRIKEEKSQLPVDVRGSKTSVLKLAVSNLEVRGLFVSRVKIALAIFVILLLLIIVVTLDNFCRLQITFRPK